MLIRFGQKYPFKGLVPEQKISGEPRLMPVVELMSKAILV
jgi:hypothetical protein